MTLRTLVEGGLTAGVVLVLALWVSAVLERQAAVDRQRPRPVDAQDRARNIVRVLLLSPAC